MTDKIYMNQEEYIKIFERYVSGNASDEEIARLIEWMKNDPSLSNWFEMQIGNASSGIDPAIQSCMLSAIQKEIGKKDVKSKHPYGTKINWLYKVAIILLPLLSALGMYLYMSGRSVIDTDTSPYIVSVDKGQKASVVLADGTKVWLNSQSQLVCDPGFNVQKRELHLTGEAYFEVAHNAAKPFIVECNNISVEALGTEFVVKAYDDDKTVSSVLIKGKVSVGTPEGKDVLIPNERIEYNRVTHKRTLENVTNAIDFADWRYNELRIENESLEEIAQTLERKYNIDLVFASEALKHQHYTGTLNNTSLESVLNLLALTSPLEFMMENHEVVLFEKNK
ncbi:FecR family protein [Microbacter margulisiae]|uniref:Ferric-dicitrate binding protein FerR (Iron transport regulator) n=1 Tax=Microbacter margulisiae TaxID=1350067 RepID=A0A7W5H1N1_9PORP|nr:FecR domain-containing protein [Microbacter margulisiae]MBB3186542.1 ferric-dicitrate binding protein FerR (iron transport regulator) [Microbacter margulisiae]